MFYITANDLVKFEFANSECEDDTTLLQIVVYHVEPRTICVCMPFIQLPLGVNRKCQLPPCHDLHTPSRLSAKACQRVQDVTCISWDNTFYCCIFILIQTAFGSCWGGRCYDLG